MTIMLVNNATAEKVTAYNCKKKKFSILVMVLIISRFIIYMINLIFFVLFIFIVILNVLLAEITVLRVVIVKVA